MGSPTVHSPQGSNRRVLLEKKKTMQAIELTLHLKSLRGIEHLS